MEITVNKKLTTSEFNKLQASLSLYGSAVLTRLNFLSTSEIKRYETLNMQNLNPKFVIHSGSKSIAVILVEFYCGTGLRGKSKGETKNYKFIK